MNIHPIQTKLLKIINKIDVNKMSLRDIGLLIDETHPQKVSHHLHQLEKKGFIKIDKKNRSISLTNPDIKKNVNDIIAVPIYGCADCGEATAVAEENLQGYLRVSRNLIGKVENIFAVRAHGPSMNQAKINGISNIEEGDYVLIDPDNRNPHNGDYILSIIDGVANIKKFFHNKSEQQIALVSESSEDIKPIFIHPDDNYMINGLVKNVIKSSLFDEQWPEMQNSAGRDAIKSLGKMSKVEADYYANLK